MGNLQVIMIKDKLVCSECFREIGMTFKRNKANEIMCPWCGLPLEPSAIDQPKKNEALKK